MPWCATTSPDRSGRRRARRFVDTLAEVAQQAEVVVLSLPDGTVSEQVARGILAADDRRTTHVIDTSTVGVAAARTIAALLGRGAASPTSTRRCRVAWPEPGPARWR